MTTVKRWCRELEVFKDLPESDKVSFQEGVRNFDFDQNLGPYPNDNHAAWKQLTSHLTSEII